VRYYDRVEFRGIPGLTVNPCSENGKYLHAVELSPYLNLIEGLFQEVYVAE
jgi:hypothetical protein